MECMETKTPWKIQMAIIFSETETSFMTPVLIM
jgi:hypothetical protein